ncbi:MAG TPA: hypothetical protein VGJ48_05285 [Pyrinomonadaceae bacterium]
MSRKKHMLSFAASSGVSGGVKRVFTSPAKGTLAISASAQRGPIDGELGLRSLFILQGKTYVLEKFE